MGLSDFVLVSQFLTDRLDNLFFVQSRTPEKRKRGVCVGKKMSSVEIPSKMRLSYLGNCSSSKERQVPLSFLN